MIGKLQRSVLFKKGLKSNPFNKRLVVSHRPWIMSKVLESVVRDALVKHFVDNGIYTEYQNGFGNN